MLASNIEITVLIYDETWPPLTLGMDEKLHPTQIVDITTYLMSYLS